MRLEDALKLKAGQKVVPDHNWLSPGEVTKGREYVLQVDAIPIYHGGPGVIVSLGPRFKGDEPINARFLIVDDTGNSAEPNYHSFEVA